jgi:tRNA(His) 5'-end guanylyltransferase
VHLQYTHTISTARQGKGRIKSLLDYYWRLTCIHDSAFRKEFDSRRTVHIKTKSLSEGFANRPIERWYNEVREVTKTRRGLGNDQSAQVFADLKRIEHNFADHI